MMVLLYGVTRVIEGASSFGEVLALNALAASMLGPLGSLMYLLARWPSLRIQTARAGEMMEVTGWCYMHGHNGDVKSMELVEVCHRYRGIRGSGVECINMKLETGKVYGIVGSSGSGKSTVARIFAGREVPCCGRVLMNDTDLLGKGREGVATE